MSNPHALRAFVKLTDFGHFTQATKTGPDSAPAEAVSSLLSIAFKEPGISQCVFSEEWGEGHFSYSLRSNNFQRLVIVQ